MLVGKHQCDVLSVCRVLITMEPQTTPQGVIARITAANSLMGFHPQVKAKQPIKTRHKNKNKASESKEKKA